MIFNALIENNQNLKFSSYKQKFIFSLKVLFSSPNIANISLKHILHPIPTNKSFPIK